MLISGVAYFLLIWNFNYFDDYMVERLYRVKKEKGEKLGHGNPWEDSSFARQSILSNPRDYFCQFIPSCIKLCRCCRPTR